MLPKQERPVAGTLGNLEDKSRQLPLKTPLENAESIWNSSR